MKQLLNKKISNSLLILGTLSTYFGYSQDASNFIPAEIKYAVGITALTFGIVGHVLNFRESTDKK